ncbi:hypothetical protein N7516_000253 [Penicillium verrucosum]|uniref:uncharacterized protein n=1 Tax=Penicillium verrucosum TaxID=60171 RepID=UPI0025453A1C|nr:uncharacterized protein N7516_000253 [Penicillium verrucosum]KAJ5940085.1 hypothetical protein N7516_000253 [Penicillium verrucosum]
MLFSYSAWFRKGPGPGTVITLDQPVPSRWKILEKLNEHDYQVNEEENDEYGFRSFASAKYICCDPRSQTKKAFIRIYIQGWSNTPKLLGYKTDKKDRSGLVPGGFIIWLVWEIVPGLRLGDGNGADPFWALESYEREQVRLAFLEALSKLHKNWWFPRVGGASSLVWHQETQTLYFIAPFDKAGKPERPIMSGANWIAHFDLANLYG